VLLAHASQNKRPLSTVARVEDPSEFSIPIDERVRLIDQEGWTIFFD
jgi:hypothetical protein